MVTGNQASPEPAVSIDQATPAPETEATAEPTVDYKAQYEELLAAKGKLEGDLKAIKGLRQTEAQREAMLLGISDRIDGIDRQQTALIKALAANETDALPQEIERIQAEGQQAKASRGFGQQYASLLQDFMETVRDADGNDVLDIYKAPELQDARQEWMRYYNDQAMGATEKIAGFARVVGQAHRVVRQTERTRLQAEAKKAREEARTTVKQKLEEAEVLDLNTGPEAGGGGNQSFETLMKKDPYKMKPKELREYNTALNAAQKRGQR